MFVAADWMELQCWNSEIVFFIIIAALATVTCQSEYEDCATNFSVFERAVFKTNNNLFKLTTTFYPPDKDNPLYVNVTYKFMHTSASVNYQWSSASLYHIIQPHTFGYLSLLFCYIEDNRIVDLELELPEECDDLTRMSYSNANSFLFVMTQRVCIIHVATASHFSSTTYSLMYVYV